MDPITQQTALAAAGAAGAAEALYVDDVFSTYLTDGVDGSKTITNGIDLLNEGGMVWNKNRDDTTGQSHFLHDTERSPQSGMPTSHRLSCNNNNQQFSDTDYVTSWNSDGFNLTGSNAAFGTGAEFVSWTFRKAPGFFDVVTWTGNTTDTTAARQISHSLGSAPGMIIAKRLDDTANWQVYHRSLGNTKYLILDTDARDSDVGGINRWRNTDPTSSDFTVGYTLNADTNTYVAYLFAHDDASFGTAGDQSIIKCGQYTGEGSGTVKEVDLGFEPQWVMIKKRSDVENWVVFDNMMGVSSNGNDAYLVPNNSDAEVSNADRINFTPTGFSLNIGNMTNQQYGNFIYVAIRRPHKPVEAGTDVFQALTFTGTSATEEKKDTNFPVDLMHTHRTNGGTPYFISRLQGTQRYMSTSSTSDEGSTAGVTEFGPDYLKLDSSGPGADNGSAYINLYFRRAPGFLDVVAYDGSSSAQTVPHNLEAVPEMMIVKKRSASDFWAVYHKEPGPTKYLRLNTASEAGQTNPTSNVWNDTAPTSSVFSVGSGEGATNESGATYIAYLFASLDGISKVGHYTGTGNDVDVDCGFDAGARFVMIHSLDYIFNPTPGTDWFFWDSTRGIVSGNDPYMAFNTTTAQTTSTDYIDPLNAGFRVTSSAPDALNKSGTDYLFLAIA